MPNDRVTYADMWRVSPDFPAYHGRFLLGSVADNLAEKFGTQGSPISLSTACASGATAIQLGVEAIRRSETNAALCIGTDGSINPEAVVRFSLLSALSTSNEAPQTAAKPFSKNRDGFVMAEGSGALVLESYDAAKARGAKILGVVEVPGVGLRSRLSLLEPDHLHLLGRRLGVLEVGHQAFNNSRSASGSPGSTQENTAPFMALEGSSIDDHAIQPRLLISQSLACPRA